jgi:hypothetical protein
MNNEQRFTEHEIEIARYRRLEREVTDPLALCLLHGSSRNWRLICEG